MKLWLLRPCGQLYDDRGPWESKPAKPFGFVIRAESERKARDVAALDGVDQIRGGNPAWLEESLSSCVELHANGEEEIIMSDQWFDP